VNLVSATSRVATIGVAPYASFKGDREVLTRYMAKEFGDRRIQANSVAPGTIRTELGGGLNDEFEMQLAGRTALGRVGEADEVGSVIASLLSDDNRWINAQSIEVSGGVLHLMLDRGLLRGSAPGCSIAFTARWESVHVVRRFHHKPAGQ
jgi:NAD(P)-dependent dehydrogenase (short-subunit alcohol dehydrogenase family)